MKRTIAISISVVALALILLLPGRAAFREFFADNLRLPGAGEIMATDRISESGIEVNYARTKFSQGVDGVAVDVSAAAPLSVVQQDPTSATRQAIFDSMSRVPIVINIEHSRVHGGNAYKVSMSQKVSDQNDKLAFGFITPDSDVRIHMFARGSASALATFYIREDPTVTNNQGTAQAAINRERNSANTSMVIDTATSPNLVGSVTLFLEADQGVYTENGKILFQETIGAGGAGPMSAGGPVRAEGEFILEQNTQYLIIMEADDANDNWQTIVLSWYEHISG